jgi:hypothetical protein
MAEVHPFTCVACAQGFTPEDGKVNMVRRGPLDHGYPMCPACFTILLAQGSLSKDHTNLKCVCGSADPDRPICPIHLSSNRVH